ncbi:MAG TPA: GNAT family N-acetyltransferase [Candidatus Sulfotelmatobacter sp.]|nr:GNAT family N-acetyltransferase [Candidatus Sulfotelmatobacter sp.]
MKLITPNIKYQQNYLKAVREGTNETGLTRISKPEEGQLFEEFVKNKIEETKGLHLPKGWVPATELWLIDNEEFIGWVNIRHSLTEHLFKIGGHIGYWIRPSKRNMGYGKMILQLAILESKKLRITNILITCDDTNLGSRRIIEANGGILENIVDNGIENPKKRRYWIKV